MWKILQNQGRKHRSACEDTTEPSSSVKMMDTSTLMSTTIEARTLVQQPIPAPMLTTVGAADLPLPFPIHVPCDGAEDVAIDATTNNQGVHTSVGIIIVVVVEEILQ